MKTNTTTIELIRSLTHEGRWSEARSMALCLVSREYVVAMSVAADGVDEYDRFCDSDDFIVSQYGRIPGQPLSSYDVSHTGCKLDMNYADLTDVHVYHSINSMGLTGDGVGCGITIFSSADGDGGSEILHLEETIIDNRMKHDVGSRKNAQCSSKTSSREQSSFVASWGDNLPRGEGGL